MIDYDMNSCETDDEQVMRKMIKNESFGALYASDDLGRLLPGEAQTGLIRPNRQVGCFYFLTSGANGCTSEPCNISSVMECCPEALKSLSHPAWGSGSMYWDEPLFGYYFQTDKWVLRRHVKLLTHAGVDFLVFDTTNRRTFWPQVKALLEVLEEYRLEGWDVPKVAYYTNTKSGETVNEIWEELYHPGLFRELWFEWKGKPFIIADPEECTPEQREFFTFRLPQWPTEAMKQGGCPWIDFERPQRAWKNENGENEIVPVSVAQHPNLSFGDGAFYNDPVPRGRAYHGAGNDKTPEALKYGYNVAEQWERAIELDPEMVFFTGWNEWTVGRIQGDEPRPVLLIDQADREYSRDAEPVKGGFFDNYFMQLCNYIRQYKGSPALPEKRSKLHIDINASFDQWEQVPAYWAMPFGTIPRRHEGHGGRVYEDETGRNEFECLKVAHDDKNIYFYARTRDDIVFNMFTKWMLLLIRVEGRPYAPDWHGFHFVVNDIVLDGNTSFAQRCLGGWRFGDNTRVAYKREGRELMIRIPRAYLEIEEDGFTLSFKWADHTCKNETIEDFYLHGDSAPYGRFSYIYTAE